MRNSRIVGKSTVLILIIITLVTAGAGLGVGLFMNGRGHSAAKHGEEGEKKNGHAAPVTVYSLGDMVVNLADPTTLRYAKVTVALGFPTKLDDAKLKSLEPALRDSVISVITDKRYDQLHRHGGMQMLKDEIRKSISDHLPDIKVSEVYLEAFAMQ